MYEDSYEFGKLKGDLVYSEERFDKHEMVFGDRNEIPSPIYPNKHKFSLKHLWNLIINFLE